MAELAVRILLGVVMGVDLAARAAFARRGGRGDPPQRPTDWPPWGDRAMWLAGAVYHLAVIAYVAYPPLLEAIRLTPPAAVRWVGAGAHLVGLGLLLWAHAALGRHFRLRVELLGAHDLVTGGPYRFVRHPMYLAELVQYGGAVLLTGDAAMVVALVALAGIFHVRSRCEDRLLADRFGEAWSDWARRAGPLWPRVRRR